jgi:hypothetical protein
MSSRSTGTSPVTSNLPLELWERILDYISDSNEVETYGGLYLVNHQLMEAVFARSYRTVDIDDSKQDIQKYVNHLLYVH